MKKLLGVGFLCAIGLFSAVRAPAQQAAPPGDTKISELDWFVSDWETTVKTDGRDRLVHIAVKKSENGQALLYSVWSKEDDKVTPEENGIYYWDPAEKAYKVTQIDRDGALEQGTLQQAGNRITQALQGVRLDGTSFALKSEWEIRPREFHFVEQRRTADGAWTSSQDVTFTRVGAGALPKLTPKKKRND